MTDSTIEVWGHTKRCLVEFFGESKDMRTITPEDADDWARLAEDRPEVGREHHSEASASSPSGSSRWP